MSGGCVVSLWKKILCVFVIVLASVRVGLISHTMLGGAMQDSQLNQPVEYLLQ